MSKIKVCGLTRREDMELVNRCHPDYIGFVFAASTRQVSRKQAELLKQQLVATVQAVGVFVDHPVDEIVDLTESGIIDLIQLHGGEDENVIRQLKARTGRQIIKAVSVKQPEDIERWQDSEADYLLFDYGKGGTGTAFDWSYLEQGGVMKKPYFLAGGINRDNLPEALMYRPYCIDVSSGAESNGRKDGAKVKELIQTVRGKS